MWEIPPYLTALQTSSRLLFGLFLFLRSLLGLLLALLVVVLRTFIAHCLVPLSLDSARAAVQVIYHSALPMSTVCRCTVRARRFQLWCDASRSAFTGSSRSTLTHAAPDIPILLPHAACASLLGIGAGRRACAPLPARPATCLCA